MKTQYELDGTKSRTLAEFARHFSSVVLRGHEWRGNLDAFNDILRGGYGTPEGGFVLIWHNHQQSLTLLGPRTFNTLVDIIRDHGVGGQEAEDAIELVLQ